MTPAQSSSVGVPNTYENHHYCFHSVKNHINHHLKASKTIAYLKDFVQLIVGVPDAGKYGHASDHLHEDAAHPPHVQRGGVLRAAEEDVGRPVPQGDHLVGVGVAGHGLGPGQAEIGQLQLADLADEEVLGLDVAVQHQPFVAVREAAQQLEEEEAHVPGVQAAAVPLQILG